MGKYKSLYESSMIEKMAYQNIITNQAKFNPIETTSSKTVFYTQMLSNKDCILCANRYINTLPINLTSQQLEAMFYNLGSLVFYNDNGHLGIAKFAKVGELNPYGKLADVIPIDLAGRTHPQKKIPIRVDGGDAYINNEVAVIISDYTGSFTDMNVIPRASLNLRTTISDQVLVFTQLITNIILSVKKALALCENEEQANIINAQVKNILDPTYPITAIARGDNKTSALENLVEMFNFDNNFETQNYCQQIEYYDKIRRSFNGVPSPDTFEKKERMITSEAANINTDTNLVLLDGYLTRLNGYNLCKKYLKGVKDIEKLSVQINPILQQTTTESEEKKDV